jgi:galactokinase/mevalonate kinase-like predicted kinase
MYAEENGKQLTHAMADALATGNWEDLGRLINEYWDDREHFEEGVTPDFAQRFRADLARWSHGTALCGSGHGGYMMVVPRSGQRPSIMGYLGAHGVSEEQVLDFEITSDGLQTEIQ